MATNYNGIPNLFTDKWQIPSRGATDVMYYTKGSLCYIWFTGQGETDGTQLSDLAKYFLDHITASYQPSYSAFAIRGWGWATEADLESTYLKMKTLLKFTKVVFIGISQGAMLATKLLTKGAANPIVKDVVAFITMSSQADDSVNLPAIPVIAGLGIPVFGSGDVKGDIHGDYTQRLLVGLRSANPKGNYPFLDTPGTAHGGWDAITAPTAIVAAGLNLTNWVTSATSGTNTAPPPVVTPPPTITGLTYSDGTKYTPSHPIKSVVINYSDGTASETKS